MSLKCVHQGCGKSFEAGADGGCMYHPGPPVFHEGQKGWSCCKPRVLTFEEFMKIEPCTQGTHSTTDLPPKVEKKQPDVDAAAVLVQKTQEATLGPALPRTPVTVATRAKADTEDKSTTNTSTNAAEDEDDDPSLPVPAGRVCQRRGCDAVYDANVDRWAADAPAESCVHHPGAPIFHEGSKGYSCCKRRVLEFDQFMKIEGCATKPRHRFVGQKKAAAASEEVKDVRFDYYQSATSLTVSFFLKKIDKARAVVTFGDDTLTLDLPTTDARRHRQTVPLFAPIDPAASTYTVLGTKLEVVLAKAAVGSWPVLRSDDTPTGEIYQVGRAGKIV